MSLQVKRKKKETDDAKGRKRRRRKKERKKKNEKSGEVVCLKINEMLSFLFFWFWLFVRRPKKKGVGDRVRFPVRLNLFSHGEQTQLRPKTSRMIRLAMVRPSKVKRFYRGTRGKGY